MSRSKRAGIVGVTGYTGLELLRILDSHPEFDLACATSRKEAGRRIDDLFPHLRGTRNGDLMVVEPDLDILAAECGLVFLAVPHGTAQEMAAGLLERGVLVVDLSADFRLRDTAVYEAWYKTPHTQPKALAEAVYGLPELYAQEIAKARLVANPGCYPTSAILGLFPALAEGLVKADGLVVDSKSGASGAGRKASVGILFCEVHDSFRAYNLGGHRHTPEIEQELSRAVWKDVKVSFNTHLLPIDRGILSTMYAERVGDHDLEAVHAAYTAFYHDRPWVRVLPKGILPETRHVRGTMFCDIGLVVDPRTNRLIVVSAIDNLCRGASGQAVANANLMTGQDPGAGLGLMPVMP
ncbi:MAG: N-acetyl-gamma-glutamyl-phosphate reductase [Deltaproteobacteria bacterium]|nr:N-acetyl-gamma-glutamyl-phosphate reductase [Deltaproteobacteria bacterium]